MAPQIISLQIPYNFLNYYNEQLPFIIDQTLVSSQLYMPIDVFFAI